MNKGIPAARAGVPFRSGPVSYLVVGLIWFVFLLFALRVPLIEPVFLWVMTQGLLVESVATAGGWWTSRIVLFVAYMAAGLVAWALVERPGLDPHRVWRRAILAWFAIQFTYCLIATILVKTGVLYE